MLYTRHTDGVRTYTVHCLKVLCMHQKSCKLVLVFVQSEKYTKSHIVNAALHSTVHGLCVICIVMLWSCRMKLLIALLVICLLEEYVGSDSCLLELSVILHCSGSDIYIYTADSSVFVLDAVDCVDTLENVLNRIVYRVLSCLDCKTLVSHILKGCDLLYYLLLSELLSRNMLIFHVIWTVNTAVHTVV